MRIAQVANFYGPRSGGLRTALAQLGAGYVAHGHEVVRVVPGARSGTEVCADGVVRITVPAPPVPGTGGYRVIDPYRVERVLQQLRPDVVEVSDRLTLRRLGRWAARRGIRSIAISHERLDRLLGQAGLPPAVAARLADAANARTAAAYDAVVCTTRFAEEEFARIGCGTVVRVPLGVDLDTFAPDRSDAGLRSRLVDDDAFLVVHCGRLSPEKHAERSIAAVAGLRRAGVAVRLVLAGDGPSRPALQRRAAGLPVDFLGFVPDRGGVARLLATADATIAPGPHETFGLAALESLACGTPVVASAGSALAEIVRPACGALAHDTGAGFADALGGVLAGERVRQRRAARRRAEQYPWSTSVSGMLTVLRAS
ncbi:glycosyltransferase [Pseudonocardia broussonetiae]|uniref:Glycosyltransferase n=1 Tax=Pseudonocardia broussonetiae TaxID=2736640 RepID=A0A6M6JL88_9PSEU|nr:glycosyltransferase [Pseudonocardia broussonetiae]QJY47727.1 glycosyltransferase [Pseudonocardia broussonetiae]